jgi:lambda repressor-like predicted transcriptional regulator
MIREKINSELANRRWSVRRLADETGIRYASLTEYLSGPGHKI